MHGTGSFPGILPTAKYWKQTRNQQMKWVQLQWNVTKIEPVYLNAKWY